MCIIIFFFPRLSVSGFKYLGPKMTTVYYAKSDFNRNKKKTKQNTIRSPGRRKCLKRSDNCDHFVYYNRRKTKKKNIRIHFR